MLEMREVVTMIPDPVGGVNTMIAHTLKDYKTFASMCNAALEEAKVTANNSGVAQFVCLNLDTGTFVVSSAQMYHYVAQAFPKGGVGHADDHIYKAYGHYCARHVQ